MEGVLIRRRRWEGEGGEGKEGEKQQTERVKNLERNSHNL